MQLPNIDELGETIHSGLLNLKRGKLLTKKLTSGRVVVMMLVCLRDERMKLGATGRGGHLILIF